MQAAVHAGDLQGRDSGVLLMATLFGVYPFLMKLYADGGYQGPKFKQGLAKVCRGVNGEIVRRCDSGNFVVLAKRWIVEPRIWEGNLSSSGMLPRLHACGPSP